MAWTRNGGSAEFSASSANSLQVNRTFTTGSTAFCHGNYQIPGVNTAGLQSATDSSSTAWTRKENVGGGINQNMDPFVCFRENIAAGVTSITVTPTEQASGAQILASASDWAGGPSSGAFDKQVNSTAGSGSGITTTGIAPTDQNALIFHCISSDGSSGGTWTNPPTGGTPAYTQDWQQSPSASLNGGQAAYHVRSGNNASQTLTTTLSGELNGYQAISVAFTPAAAAGGADLLPLLGAG